MWNRISRVAPLLILAVIAYGCGTAENPTAPQLSVDAGGTLSTAKKLPKVDICHITGNGKYVMINVSENAKPAHLAHGDSLPGQDGLDENCVASTAFVTFIDVTAIWAGEGAWVTWTVDGTSDPVTYSLQGRFGALPFEDSGGSFPVLGTGQGTYSVVDYYGYDEYRVRAVDGDGNEVFSPGAVVQY